VIAGFLAPLTRENVGVPIIGGVLAALYLRQVRWLAAAAVGVAVLSGSYIAFSQVPSSSPHGIASVIWEWIIRDFRTVSSAARFSSMLVIGLGFFWLPLLFRRFVRFLQPHDWIMLSVACVFMAVSVFGGGDTDRIVMPVGILLCVVVARVALRESDFVLPLSFLAAAYFIAQCPFTIVGSSAAEYIAFFEIGQMNFRDFANNGIAPVLLAVLVAAVGLSALQHSDEKRLETERDRGVSHQPTSRGPAAGEAQADLYP
jgi:hypothetical protein